jgi:hypothetical protein
MMTETIGEAWLGDVNHREAVTQADGDAQNFRERHNRCPDFPALPCQSATRAAFSFGVPHTAGGNCAENSRPSDPLTQRIGGKSAKFQPKEILQFTGNGATVMAPFPSLRNSRPTQRFCNRMSLTYP